MLRPSGETSVVVPSCSCFQVSPHWPQFTQASWFTANFYRQNFLLNSFEPLKAFCPVSARFKVYCTGSGFSLSVEWSCQKTRHLEKVKKKRGCGVQLRICVILRLRVAKKSAQKNWKSIASWIHINGCKICCKLLALYGYLYHLGNCPTATGYGYILYCQWHNRRTTVRWREGSRTPVLRSQQFPQFRLVSLRPL